jgi:tRNA(His) guanylyltransferase
MSDDIGDRMKKYEMEEAGRKLMPLLPVMARLDGRAFHSFTHGMARPFDERMTRLMVETTKALVAESGAVIGYTQSDEISLVLYSDNQKTQVFFDGRIQKLASVLASYCTAVFVRSIPQFLPEKDGLTPTFDCRVWNVPTKWEAVNTITWREFDAVKNSISSAARAHFSHKQVDGKSGSEMQDMLHSIGINWNDYPAFFKRGTYVQRKKTVRRFTAEEIEELPAGHDARTNPDLMVERSDVVGLWDVPPIARMTNRVEFVFDGADPVVSQPDGDVQARDGKAAKI